MKTQNKLPEGPLLSTHRCAGKHCARCLPVTVYRVTFEVEAGAPKHAGPSLSEMRLAPDNVCTGKHCLGRRVPVAHQDGLINPYHR